MFSAKSLADKWYGSQKSTWTQYLTDQWRRRRLPCGIILFVGISFGFLAGTIVGIAGGVLEGLGGVRNRNSRLI